MFPKQQIYERKFTKQIIYIRFHKVPIWDICRIKTCQIIKDRVCFSKVEERTYTPGKSLFHTEN